MHHIELSSRSDEPFKPPKSLVGRMSERLQSLRARGSECLRKPITADDIAGIEKSRSGGMRLISGGGGAVRVGASMVMGVKTAAGLKIILAILAIAGISSGVGIPIVLGLAVLLIVIGAALSAYGAKKARGDVTTKKAEVYEQKIDQIEARKARLAEMLSTLSPENVHEYAKELKMPGPESRVNLVKRVLVQELEAEMIHLEGLKSEGGLKGVRKLYTEEIEAAEKRSGETRISKQAIGAVVGWSFIGLPFSGYPLWNSFFRKSWRERHPEPPPKGVY